MLESNKKFQEWAKVEENIALGSGLYHLVLHSPRISKALSPGSFVLFSVREESNPSKDPFLPRPFSVMAANASLERIELFYRVVGRGTTLMTALTKGESVQLIGPLGRPWPQVDGDLILVAGGVGMPPILYLAEDSVDRNGSVNLFYGGRSSADIKLIERFEKAGVDIHIATDDGTSGRKGNCVEALEEWLDGRNSANSTIYGCGPDPMLQALSKTAKKHSIPAHVSLEAPMACGIGVCRGCAVSMKDGNYKMACSDGPVFGSEEVLFK